MNNLKARTKKFALDIIRLCTALPKREDTVIITRQLMRSATSVAANYRSACRGKSKPDFINKLSTVEEEADESALWLELLSELNVARSDELPRLLKEANELVGLW
jgi:four helix bundle protein